MSRLERDRGDHPAGLPLMVAAAGGAALAGLLVVGAGPAALTLYGLSAGALGLGLLGAGAVLGVQLVDRIRSGARESRSREPREASVAQESSRGLGARAGLSAASSLVVAPSDPFAQADRAWSSRAAAEGASQASAKGRDSAGAGL